MKDGTPRLLALAVCAALLPACGGSGGGSAPPPPPAPAAPGGLSVAAGDAELTISWNAVFEATHYTLYGSTTPGVTAATASIVVPDLTTSPKAVGSLTNGTPYYFVVVARNGSTAGPPSAEASGTPLPLPGEPTDLAATIGHGQIQLDWTEAPFATAYAVYRATAPGVTPESYAGLPGGARVLNVQRPYTWSGLTNGTTYYFVVTALNARGESAPSAEVSGDPVPPPPAAPAGVSATRGDGQVLLTWSAVTGATSYTVYGASVPGVTPANYAGLASGFRLQNASRPQTLSGLVNGTTYYFVVSASNLGGEGAASAEVSATPIPPPPPPAAPSALGGDEKITLTWGASANAASYVIYSAEAPGVGPASWSTLPGGRRVIVQGSPYERRGLSNGTAYYFVVAGVNDVGEGAPSAECFATPLYAGGPELLPLGFRPVDAEYDRVHERIVAVSELPHRLWIVDPVTLASESVALPLKPSCVSVAPDGLSAAAGHDGWISVVDLTTKTLEKTVRCTSVIRDLVLAGNGYAYATSTANSFVGLRSVRLSDGAETETIHFNYAHHIKLHASGTSIYAGDTGVSPTDIRRYDISSGAAVYARDSPYHGTYPSGGPVWMSEDGLRIFTFPGSVYRTSPGAGTDMQYNGDLAQTGLIQSLDHRTSTGVIALIPSNGFSSGFADVEAHVYDSAFLGFLRRVPLRPFAQRGMTWASRGLFLFIHGDGDRAFVLVRADAKSGLNSNHGLLRMSLGASSAPVPTGLVSRASSSTSAFLSWDPVPGATGYKVYWARHSGVLPGNAASLPGGGSASSAATSASVSGLSNATVYAVVTALTPAGETDPSPELAIELAPGSGSPAAPVVTVTPGDGRLTLSWTPSAQASSYVVYGARQRGANATSYGSLAGGFRHEVAAGPLNVDGLVNGALYFVRVAARNASGEGGVSPEQAAVPTADPAPSSRALSYRPVDVEYSRSLNLLVSIAQSPSSLRLLDPESGAEASVALPAPPTCLALSPDGTRAAVGHNAFVSLVNLSTASLLQTWSVPTDVYDLTLFGDGFAYVIPASGQWVSVIGLDTATGALTQGWTIRHRSRVQRHPSGASFYAISTDSSPSDPARFAVSAGTVTSSYDSPYHGDYSVGNQLWMAADGQFLLTQGGSRFRVTEVMASDLRYQGRLAEADGIGAADHHPGGGLVAAVPMDVWHDPADGDTRVHIADDLYLETAKVVALPPFLAGGTPYKARGKFVFFRADGSKAYVVAMADVASGLLNDHAVFTFDPR